MFFWCISSAVWKSHSDGTTVQSLFLFSIIASMHPSMRSTNFGVTEFGRVLISAALSSLINDENERRDGSSEAEKIQMCPCARLL